MIDINKVKKIGEDVRLSELAVISRPELMELGSHISIDQWVYISTKAKLGSYIHIAPSVSIIGGASAEIIMEDFTNIGSGSRIVCATNDFSQGLISPVVPAQYQTVITKPVVFKRYSTVGVNCVILPGVTLAEGSIVGANSLVKSDTEPWTIYAGSPAKPIGKRDSKKAIESGKILMNYKD